MEWDHDPALAKAAFVLNESRNAEAAEAGAEFLLNHLWMGRHSSARGEEGARNTPPISMTMLFVAGLLDLYETTGKRWPCKRNVFRLHWIPIFGMSKQVVIFSYRSTRKSLSSRSPIMMVQWAGNRWLR